MSNYKFRVYPPRGRDTSREGPSSWIVRVESPSGMRYAISLSLSDPAVDAIRLDPPTVVALVADLLRPGWRSILHFDPQPAIVSRKIFRGFSFDRRTRTESGPLWRLSCSVEANLLDLFSWDEACDDLDRLHLAIAGDSGSSYES